MNSITSPSVEEYRTTQQARNARESAKYLSTLSKDKLTPRQTQVLMNKYPIDKAMYIAKRYNTLKGIK